jgi:hypothetical protein
MIIISLSVIGHTVFAMHPAKLQEDFYSAAT